MPDREKVIKAWEIFRDSNPYEICSGREFRAIREPEYCMGQMIADTIALLKEQEEPKQIVRKQCKIEHNDGSVDYFAEWYCPHCKLLIVRGFDNPSIKFCYKCGKPILWERR